MITTAQMLFGNLPMIIMIKMNLINMSESKRF